MKIPIKFRLGLVLVAVAGLLFANSGVKVGSAFEVIPDPDPDEVQLAPLASPPYELAPFQFRECKFTAAFFATTSDLTEFVPDELELMTPPATGAGTTLMIAFGGKCPRTTMGPCAFTLLLAPVKLDLPGHPEDGNFLGMFPIFPYVTNINYYKYCEVIGGCPLKLGDVVRKEKVRTGIGAEVTIEFSRLDIRPINESGEFDIAGEAPKKATKLVVLTVDSLAPIDATALENFENATGLPFRDPENNLVFGFPPLVNYKAIPSVEAGLDVSQLARVPFGDQMPMDAMFGPATLSLGSSVADPIADNISVLAVFGGVNFEFDFEFGWPAGDILHDYLAP